LLILHNALIASEIESGCVEVVLRSSLSVLILASFLLASTAASESLTIIDVIAQDTPYDGGGSVTIRWDFSIDQVDAAGFHIEIFRRAAGEQQWNLIGNALPKKLEFVDRSVSDGVHYQYKLVAGSQESIVGPVMSSAQWFDVRRLSVLLGLFVCALATGAVTLMRRRGRSLYVRPLRGLEAVDEAVGRATEMGKPILYTPGWGGDIQRPTTIASLNILSHVARKAGEYKCELLFPTHDPVIMAAADEVIREAYTAAGEADSYTPGNVIFTTSSQLGYAAAVDGLITRHRPAAVFLLGTFEGEALILAETANSVGALQIAGTDSTIQLSFFIVACDYTLIGEELFAASGYLTRDEKVLRSILVQDYLKLALGLALIVGAVLTTLGYTGLADWLGGS
jgi:hypothetical protein